MNTARLDRLGDPALLLLLGASLALNVYFFWKGANHQDLAPAPQFARGDSIAGLTTQNLNGEEVTLGFALDRPTVLYVFRPTCIWCARNAGSLDALHANAKNAYRFVGISLDEDGVPAFVERTRIPFPVLVLSAGNNAFRIRVGGVPQTLVVSTNGKVLEAWSGAYGGETRNEMEAYFDTELPALTTAEPPPAVSADLPS